MQLGSLARYALFAALLGVSVLTYLREQQPRESLVPSQTPGVIAAGERQTTGAPAARSRIVLVAQLLRRRGLECQPAAMLDRTPLWLRRARALAAI